MLPILKKFQVALSNLSDISIPKIVSEATLSRCLWLGEARYLIFQHLRNCWGWRHFNEPVPWVEGKTYCIAWEECTPPPLGLPETHVTWADFCISPSCASRSKERNSGHAKGFWSNYRNVHGEMSLWVFALNSLVLEKENGKRINGRVIPLFSLVLFEIFHNKKF